MKREQELDRTATAAEASAELALITVLVNGKPVRFRTESASGLEIKETAIRQGVQIETDFILYRIAQDGTMDQIADNEKVRLHDRMEFRAVAPDDNS